MKKLLFSAMILAGGSFTSQAQLANGSIAPDFTVTAYQSWLNNQGMNNNGTYKLYDYLDAGYTVILDVSATWCGPCWNYHLSGALDDVYINHGPAGHYGVSATTTDDVMVIWIEGDGATADATMLDGSGSIGNWIEPNATLGQVPFPMANPASAQANTINNGYSIGYYPTIYKICPNRTITLVGQMTAAQLYSSVASCPPPASETNDPAILGYTGVNKSCGATDLTVRLQNNGTTPLTSCTITASEGATQIAQFNWTGNLDTYGIANVTVGQFTPTTANHNLTFSVTSADNNAANNNVSATVGRASTGSSNNITIKVDLDRYGSETSWRIKRSNGQVAYSSPTYTDAAANGTYPQADLNIFLPDDCYSLEVLDSYGDGFDSGYGNGKVEIWSNGVLIGGVSNFPSGDLAKDAFELDAVAGIEENLANTLSVYPNPATDIVNVSFEANGDYEIAILDLQGRVVASQSLKSLSGTQNVEFPVSDLAKGSYIVKISTNGVSQTQNVVIR